LLGSIGAVELKYKIKTRQQWLYQLLNEKLSLEVDPIRQSSVGFPNQSKSISLKILSLFGRFSSPFRVSIYKWISLFLVVGHLCTLHFLRYYLLSLSQNCSLVWWLLREMWNPQFQKGILSQGSNSVCSSPGHNFRSIAGLL